MTASDWRKILKQLKNKPEVRAKFLKHNKPKERKMGIAAKKCEKCGKPMLVKTGRRGKFLACSGYPGCRSTRPLGGESKTPPQETDEKCEKCGAPMVVRRSRRGPFLGCSAYPKCRSTKSLPESSK